LNFEIYQDLSDLSPSTLRRLGERDVHVWQLSLNNASSEASSLHQLLSPDEAERAARFRFEKHRDNFVVGRARLRMLLASYLGIAAPELRFTYAAQGKPLLSTVKDKLPLAFNVSHSGEMVVCAFTLSRRIGVDVELVRRDFNVEEIAERFFSAAERLVIRNLPAEQRYEGFFRCWTRKEAYIKAIGEGLSHPLHLFDVSLEADADNALLATRPAPSEAGRWKLRSLPIASGYVAALAVEIRSA
jgi:4'-phosphopantetheinyl transferase